MLQLVNFSNYVSDLTLINNDGTCLERFLREHRLDGIEMMFCGPWDKTMFKSEWIHGVHLRFWPNWLDFWRGDKAELKRQFGNDENIRTVFGGLTRQDWLAVYRNNIQLAAEAGAAYAVFHVSHARTAEVFHWQFSASNREVIDTTIELVNELAADIPADMTLLFENLWWPGLTLKNPDLAGRLLEGVKHPNVGLMVDTGHLMNTNQEIATEEQGIDYVIDTLESLGQYRKYVRGLHLHQSLSGEYVKHSMNRSEVKQDIGSVLTHVLKIDQHRPFISPDVQKIIQYVQPDYLVHEFMFQSLADFSRKLMTQQQALGIGRY